jgi:hypothetical protein
MISMGEAQKDFYQPEQITSAAGGQYVRDGFRDGLEGSIRIFEAAISSFK